MRPTLFAFAVLRLLLSSSTSAVAEDTNDGMTLSSAFSCGASESAEEIPLSADFSKIIAGATCDNQKDCEFLFPKEIHWHIYALPAGSTPKHSMVPPGIVKPSVSEGVLRYTVQDVLEGYELGDSVKAGVNLYIPLDKMNTIKVDGVHQLVEVLINDDFMAELNLSEGEPIKVRDSGVDNHVMVTSPYIRVDYAGSGVDNIVEMDVASGSSVDVSGVDQDIRVKCDLGLTLRATGVDQTVLIEGQLYNAVLAGVDTEIEVNYAAESDVCANVTKTGVDNNCQSTEDTVTLETLSCLADTEARYYCSSHWPFSIGAAIGVGLGILAAILGIICCCIFLGCFCCVCRKKRSDKATEYGSNPSPNTGISKKLDEEASSNDTVMEAEVIESKLTENAYADIKSDTKPTENSYADIENDTAQAYAKTY